MIVRYVCVSFLILQVMHAIGVSKLAVIERSFHHKNQAFSGAQGIEAVVFYLSGSRKPVLLCDQVISATNKVRIYKFLHARCDQSVLQTFPLKSQAGYSMNMASKGSHAELSIQYNPARCMISASFFESIRGQPAIVFYAVPCNMVDADFNAEVQSKCVVIDCGHGGLDTGAIGISGGQEKDITLSVGKLLKKCLEDQGVSVVLTRSVDRDIRLDQRTSDANLYRPNLFISLHANYSVSPTASGIETWYIPARIAHIPDISDVTGIGLIDHTIKRRAEWCKMASYQIHTALISTVRRHVSSVVDRGMKQAFSQVLLGVEAPAVLIELGFVSNPSEERLLRSVEYQKVLARGICVGITGYLWPVNSNAK